MAWTSGVVVVLEVERLELALLVVEVVDRGGAQPLHGPAAAASRPRGRRVVAQGVIASRASSRAAAMTPCSASICVEEVAGDTGPLEVRPGHRVLALVVVGQLGVEVVPGPATARRHGPRRRPGKVSRAREKRSRSRRKAPWMTLFMLIVGIGPA